MLSNLGDFLSFNTIFHFYFGNAESAYTVFKVETSGIGMILFDWGYQIQCKPIFYEGKSIVHLGICLMFSPAFWNKPSWVADNLVGTFPIAILEIVIAIREKCSFLILNNDIYRCKWHQSYVS